MKPVCSQTKKKVIHSPFHLLNPGHLSGQEDREDPEQQKAEVKKNKFSQKWTREKELVAAQVKL